ncbi:aminoglycoside phosphotransferase family protein [Nonomuraea spiralis]|uniref:Aminoglycoside phosphotransferase family protein n=1 Tax=Nonomuraea spiralis TaxID=46182 RepID=A0ABV5IF13_9ACTN|nr:aminoglycoside phosphotransferase family protein [Nonomuraea spiralis]GGS70761.1 phosphotransferase [Nonomuraea spiralis]
MGGRMHADEADIDEALVRRLLAAQFPRWAGLPLRRFPSAGTVNAVYRLGDDLAVRLPRIPQGVGDVAKEQRWLPVLAPVLPVPIPAVLGSGSPGEGFPWAWSVCRWLDGDNPDAGALSGGPLSGGAAAPAAGQAAESAVDLAADLAAFVGALREVDPAGAPDAYRGGPLARLDTATRAAIGELDGLIDTGAATAAWEEALSAPEWLGGPVWVHADLMPGNLLVRDGRLSGVIDWGTLGAGDPACDLIPAWNLLPPAARDVFRAELGADDAMWARGRGRALSMALIQLPYYKDTNPAMAANARHVIGEVLGGPAR